MSLFCLFSGGMMAPIPHCTMKKKKIGETILSDMHVVVYADPGMNGCTFHMPHADTDGVLQVVVGIGEVDEWWRVLSGLLHELMEAWTLQARLCHWPVHSSIHNSNTRIFVMDHTQMDEMTTDVAYAIEDVRRELHKAWKRANPEETE